MFSFPATGDTLRPDSKHITEINNGDHIGIVIQLCIEIDYFCCLTYICIVLSSIFCITLLNEKSHVTSTVFN